MSLEDTFPMTFNTEYDLKKFINDNIQYVNNIINDPNNYTNKILQNELKEQRDKLKEQQNKIKEQNDENKNLLDELECAKSKLSCNSSVYTGMFDEKMKLRLFSKAFCNEWTITNDGKTESMDLTFENKKTNIKIGCELKDKKNISSGDINRFRKDKTNPKNNFKAGIFISNSSNIKYGDLLLDTTNTYKIINNELFIYSSDINFIIIIVSFFLKNINDDITDFKDTEYVDTIIQFYKSWNSVKKACVSMDKQIVLSLGKLGLELDRGHIYLICKSKWRRKTNPY